MISLYRNFFKNIQENRGKTPSTERDYVVDISNNGISCCRPDGFIEEVTWNELQIIEIHTTDKGPFEEDVFWVLHGDDRGCVIPQGATNNEDLLTRLQELPGFDNETFMEAMGCAQNAEFIIWKK